MQPLAKAALSANVANTVYKSIVSNTHADTLQDTQDDYIQAVTKLDKILECIDTRVDNGSLNDTDITFREMIFDPDNIKQTSYYWAIKISNPSALEESGKYNRDVRMKIFNYLKGLHSLQNWIYPTIKVNALIASYNKELMENANLGKPVNFNNGGKKSKKTMKRNKKSRKTMKRDGKKHRK
jgi:hypothetical protein